MGVGVAVELEVDVGPDLLARGAALVRDLGVPRDPGVRSHTVWFAACIGDSPGTGTDTDTDKCWCYPYPTAADTTVFRWELDGSPAHTGDTWSYTFDTPGDYVVKLYIDDQPACQCYNDDPVELGTVTVRVQEVDLDIQGVAEADEEDPGGYVPLNNDDDNSNGQADKDEQGTVSGEDDLISITLDGTNVDWVTLSATVGGPRIAVWTTATKGTEVTLPKVYLEGELPKTLYVEGITTSASERDVSLQLKGRQSGYGGCTDVVTITVWDVIISKCNDEWLPTDCATIAQITATIEPSGVTGTIKFTLFDVSDEPGCCLNAGDYTTADKDLKFLDYQDGFTISENRDVATTTSAVNSASIYVMPYDYGAWGKIKAEATVNGVTMIAHISGSDVRYATIPRDDDANNIADGWPHNQGANTDDSDNTPAGDGTEGDNLTRYEEYRGVLVQNAHTRTNPNEKDFFAVDLSGFNTLGSFPSAGMPVAHRLRSAEVDPTNQRVDFNSETAPGGVVYAIQLVDMQVDPPAFGVCTGPVWSPGKWAKVYRERVQEYIDDPQKNPHGHTFAELQAWIIAHELGHSVLWHRGGDNHGHHEDPTEQDCVMYTPCDTTRQQYPDDFCTANPGCRTLWKVR